MSPFSKHILSFVGAWRSLVAHLHGVQGVGGSNPPVPTKLRSEKQRDRPVMDDWPFWFLGVAYAFLCFVTVPSPFLNS